MMYQTGSLVAHMVEHTKHLMRRKRPSRAKVRRLRFHGPNGKPYVRPQHVENAIAGMLSLPHSERAAKAAAACSEALVYFVRRRDDNDEQYHDAFAGELSTRVIDIADWHVRGLREVTGEDIVMKVHWEFMQLILFERPSADTEFLEVAFAFAVKKRTLQLVSQYKSSPWASRDLVLSDPDDNEKDNEQLKRIPDPGPGPEGVLLDEENTEAYKKLYDQARHAITDPRHREAATLHWGHRWPIVSKIRGKDDLVTHFRTTEARIKRWLKQAMKQMRAALGVEVTK
jgi:hypothetical protein